MESLTMVQPDVRTRTSTTSLGAVKSTLRAKAIVLLWLRSSPVACRSRLVLHQAWAIDLLRKLLLLVAATPS